MSIVVIKERTTLRILECSEDIPEGTRLVLQPVPDFGDPSALELAQLESISRDAEEDWGDLLDPLTLPPGQLPLTPPTP